jgi:hypothetical protein
MGVAVTVLSSEFQQVDKRVTFFKLLFQFYGEPEYNFFLLFPDVSSLENV